MSYASVWAGKIAARVESGDYAAAHEVSTDDTGCSTTLEYALARAVDTLFAECTSLRLRAESAERERDEALTTLGRQCNSCEAYAKGQMDMKEAAEEAAVDTWSWDEAIKAIRNLPIKERP